MIQIEDKSKCCGCWACENVCPVHCIDMIEDDEGFRYPHVDVDRCIECHQCEKVCPELKPILDDSIPKLSYVVQNKNKEILRNSTSGGFYTAISRYVISQGGVVVGAAFDSDMTLRHSCAKTMEDMAKFRGSKYVQSLIGNSYAETKKLLKQGRIVVFSGTPCQIAGLYGYLGNKRYDNLITVDLVCRGTPSPRLLKHYLNYHEQRFGSHAIDYRSRDKYYSYQYSTATIFFNNNVQKSYHCGKESDFMLSLYFKNLISRPSCYDCHYKTINRVSDFTIFDCWDAPRISSVFSGNGATNVFIHTGKGMEIFSKIKNDFVIAKTNALQIIDTDGVMIKHKVPMNPKRRQFFIDMQSMTIPQLSKKYDCKSLLRKIIIIAKPFLYKVGFFGVYMELKRILR